MGKDMWEYDKKLKAWYWEEDDGFIISICQRKNSPKYEVWVMGGANLIDTKIVNSIEEGKKMGKKEMVDRLTENVKMTFLAIWDNIIIRIQ